MKIKLFIILTIFLIVMSSCSSSKTSMRKHRKGKCDCPTWSVNPDSFNKYNDIAVLCQE